MEIKIWENPRQPLQKVIWNIQYLVIGERLFVMFSDKEMRWVYPAQLNFTIEQVLYPQPNRRAFKSVLEYSFINVTIRD